MILASLGFPETRKPLNPPLGSPENLPGPSRARYIIPSAGPGPGAGKRPEQHPGSPGTVHTAPPAATYEGAVQGRVHQGRVYQGGAVGQGSIARVPHPGYTTLLYPPCTPTIRLHQSAQASPSASAAVLSLDGTLVVEPPSSWAL